MSKEKLEKVGELNIKKFLEEKGCIVHLIENKTGTGRGCPDMLVIKGTTMFLFEMKKKSTLKDLRPGQKETLIAIDSCSLALGDDGRVHEYWPLYCIETDYPCLETWYGTLYEDEEPVINELQFAEDSSEEE
jgi:hypothetical protein